MSQATVSLLTLSCVYTFVDGRSVSGIPTLCASNHANLGAEAGGDRNGVFVCVQHTILVCCTPIWCAARHIGVLHTVPVCSTPVQGAGLVGKGMGMGNGRGGGGAGAWV